jgi:hypothetical protein
VVFSAKLGHPASYTRSPRLPHDISNEQDFHA